MEYRTTRNRSDDILIDAYFRWLCDQTDDEFHVNQDYFSLLLRLFYIRFRYFIDNDQNRAGDGVYLHHEFAQSFGVSDEEIDAVLDPSWENCSVLEMLIGVAKRIDDILWDPDEGVRTGKWFWMMIRNLGLDDCCDENFNEECVEKIDHWIDNFMTRDYSPDGFGGLFPLKNPKTDQRNVEIWYQMQAWIGENFDF